MRIAFVTQWFPPERGTALSKSTATSLASLGHDVDVLTGFPNYPTGVLYDGWEQRIYQREELTDRVAVHRTVVYPSHDSNAGRRMANYLSYAASATVVSANRIPPPDVWLVYSSPATAAVPAQLARPSRRAPTCLWIQDLWPDSVSGSGMVNGVGARVAHRALESYVKASYRHASRIGVISPGMTQVLAERGVPQDKIEWTPNWLPEEAPTRQAPRSELGLPTRGRLFLYAGNLGGLQGLADLVDAFALVPEATLVLLGDGIEREQLERRTRTLPNVHMRPSVEESLVPQFLAAADVLVVSLRDTPLLRATMPSKVQASLRAGRPVLAHVAGDAAELIESNDAGLAAQPGDRTATAAAITRLARMPDDALTRTGKAARECFQRTFSESVGARRLETMLVNAQEDGRR